MENNNEIQSLIDYVLNKLKENTEWEERYARYIDYIKKKYEQGIQPTKDIPEWLSLYTSISRRDGKSYDLRFKGQSIGELIYKRDKIILKPRTNLKKYFGIDIPKEEMEWDKAKDFCELFKNLNDKTNKKGLKSPEHLLESMLLKEFAKQTRAEKKVLPNIQPVKLYDSFFQMPTPLKASNKELKYSGPYSGGIDILARVTTKHNGHQLCIIEVKDENENKEPQSIAMKQALVYATFIAKLLRSKSGQLWYDFFMNRFKRPAKKGFVPEELHLNVVTIMPEGNTEELSNLPVYLPEVSPKHTTILHCYSLYFKKDDFEKELLGLLPSFFIDQLRP